MDTEEHGGFFYPVIVNMVVFISLPWKLAVWLWEQGRSLLTSKEDFS
jgi:hypothetical protein